MNPEEAREEKRIGSVLKEYGPREYGMWLLEKKHRMRGGWKRK